MTCVGIKDQLFSSISKNYMFDEITNIVKIEIGWALKYTFISNKEKYFVKIEETAKGNSNFKKEVEVCNKLNKYDINCSNFISNIYEKEYTKLDENYNYHIQEYIEGTILEKNMANDRIILDAVKIISKVHKILENESKIKRESITLINNKDYHMKTLSDLRIKIHENNKISLIQKKKMLVDIELREKIILNTKLLDMSKLTFKNGHGDFSITQVILTDNNQIVLVDFSETAYIPVIWELLRFYQNSTQYKITDNEYIELFNQCLELYESEIELNEYDKKVLYILNSLYMAQALTAHLKFLEFGDAKFYKKVLERNQMFKNSLKLIEYTRT